VTPLLEASELVKEFPLRGAPWTRRRRRAGNRAVARVLDRVSLTLARGECLAVVGESGSGKTTLGRALLRLLPLTSGSIRFDGEDLLGLPAGELRRRRRRFQMVFQDPYGSLDPRRTVAETVAEPLVVHATTRGAAERSRRRAAVADLLAAVGLAAELAPRYPHELSGGQRQRVAIARALATAPDLLIADEPTSALDLSIRAQILDLLGRQKERLGLALMLIAHDLGAVERLADRVAVLYLGRLVEIGPASGLFATPLHPYTASLLSAVPTAQAPPGGRGSRRRIVLAGEPPSPADPPSGCPFHPRCPIARLRCAGEEPPLAALPGGGQGSLVACFYPGELAVHGPP